MLKTVAATALLCAVSMTSATAADLITYPISTASQMSVASTAPTYDWNGFYAGVFGAYQHSPAGGGQFGLGIDAGINTTFDFVLAGAEVAVTGLGGETGSTTYAQALGRAGLLVGDAALLYGAVGYGLDVGAAGDRDLLAGGGFEYALSDAVSLRAQYLHGFPVTGANPKEQVTLGAQFHF